MYIYIYVQWIWQKLWKNDGSWWGSLEIRHKVILFQENYLIFQVITPPNNKYSRCLFLWSSDPQHPTIIPTASPLGFSKHHGSFRPLSLQCPRIHMHWLGWSNILCMYIVCIVFGLAFPSFFKVLLYAHVYECVYIYCICICIHS